MSKAVNLARAVSAGGVLEGGQVQAAEIIDIADVAISGSYTDLLDKPSIPSITGLASETYVATAISNLVNGAPGTLDTLKEIADQLATDETATAAIVTTLGTKANTSSLAAVATTGSYTDLLNKPTLFSGSYTDLTSKPTLFSGSYTDLTNKPTLFSGSYVDLTNTPTLATVASTGSYTDLTNKPTMAAAVGYSLVFGA